MRKILLILLSFILLGCSRTKNYYKGCVYYGEKPLSNVSVWESDNNLVAKTDSLGYFKLKNSSSSHLIFLKKGYKTDSVRLIRLHPVSKLFLRARTDTLFMEKEK